MKIFSTLFAIAIATSFSYSQEVDFSSNWNASLIKAKKENKYILIDFYTDWCGWCKVQDTATWEDPMVAEYINENFVAVKLNAEKEGGDVAVRFRPTGYPTVLLFDPNSSPMRIIEYSGYNPNNEAYISKMKSDLVSGWDTINYDPTGTAPAFPAYISARYSQERVQRPTDSAYNAWFAAQEDLTNEAAWAVISFTPDNLPESVEQSVLSNLDTYEGIYGKNAVNKFIERYNYSKILAAETEPEMEAAVSKAMDIDRSETDFNTYKILWYRNVEDWRNYMAAIKAVISNSEDYTVDAGWLNSLLWIMVEKECEDEALCVEAAETLVSQIDENKPDPNYLDTVAWLYYRGKDNQNATDYANLAIELAGEMDSSQDLLDKIAEEK